ncbi:MULTISPECIES: HAD-IA family hydrolase [unclassified Solwaraspora]|uniref:HAD-IA family hydrolase n=1 Tax=unclassified Solwaraspora TaxID=2627926 RepID=UPI00259BAC27|nr:HAD-IA family hydrolase [Solwaraspora sp. WMMA2056]WJK42460.1 HAD-IA family hydrolase [Solwaraspora sp. WMMA2056]
MTAHPGAAVDSWLVFDYGKVISLPQPPDALAAMAAVAGVPAAGFEQRYWQHRDAYDGGWPPGRYWSQVVGRPLADDDPLAAELDRADVASWSHLNPDTVRFVADCAAAGHGLALLSNAPASIALAIEAAPWAQAFQHLLFSCRLGLTKPDPAIFQALLRQLGAPAGQVTFVDDRPENVAAAAAAGLTALCYPQLPAPGRGTG